MPYKRGQGNQDLAVLAENVGTYLQKYKGEHLQSELVSMFATHNTYGVDLRKMHTLLRARFGERLVVSKVRRRVYLEVR